MNKPLILFDIDETLINTNQVIASHYQNFAKLFSTNPQDVSDIFKSYRDSLENYSDFSPENCVKYLADHYKHDTDEVEQIFYNSDNFGSALFPESKEVLQKLKSMGVTLGVYSEGVENFQKRKLKENNIFDFFDPKHLYILRRKMEQEAVSNLPENTIIIDDKSAVISFLEKFPHIIPLHLVRNADTLYGEYTLSSLDDLFPILDSLSHS